MDISLFRSTFTEFSDTTKYPNALISFWAGLAEKQVLSSVWKDCTQTGVYLYVAHEITLAAQSAHAGKIGGAPGSQGGIASSKTVGSVTVNYDPNTTTEKDAGYWNLTNYGKQFIRLARIFGAGAVQL